MTVLNGGDGGAGEVFPPQCLLSGPPSAVAVVVISEWWGVNGIHCTVYCTLLCTGIHCTVYCTVLYCVLVMVFIVVRPSLQYAASRSSCTV